MLQSSLLGQFVGYKENEVLWILLQGPYSQHFIFFLTDKWAYEARVLYYTMVEKLANDKHSSLLVQFVGYEENEVLWIRLQGPYSQHFFYFLMYELDQ